MLYRSHIASSITLSTVVAVASGYPFTVGFVAKVTLGSLLPDIDEPQSFIGRRSFGVSRIIKKKFGHRGVTHSLFCWVVVSIICLFFANPLALGVSLGYLFHILGDLFSISGVPLFAPIKKEKVKMFIRYRTQRTCRTSYFFYLCSFIFVFMYFK